MWICVISYRLDEINETTTKGLTLASALALAERGGASREQSRPLSVAQVWNKMCEKCLPYLGWAARKRALQTQ